jgi:hypothetical protein
MTPDLASLERRFLRLISQPEPLQNVARSLDASDPGIGELSSWLLADGEALASTRLGIYAHMYFARLSGSLREDYPKAAQLLAADFELLAARYLIEYPSDHPSLRYHGRHFPEFLRRCVSGELPMQLALRSDVPDLCALEWARIDVFDAEAQPILRQATLAALPAEAWGASCLRSVSACRLINTHTGVAGVWLTLEQANTPAPDITAADLSALNAGSELCSPRLGQASEWVFVWRRGFRVYHRVVDAREAAALNHLRTPSTLAELCEACEDFASLSCEPLRASTSEWLQGRLAQWLADEVLVDTLTN